MGWWAFWAYVLVGYGMASRLDAVVGLWTGLVLGAMWPVFLGVRLAEWVYGLPPLAGALPR